MSLSKKSQNLVSVLAACKSSDLPPQQSLTFNSMALGGGGGASTSYWSNNRCAHSSVFILESLPFGT